MVRIVRVALVVSVPLTVLVAPASAHAQVYPPSACVIGVSAVTVTEGSQLTVTGTGFPPGPVAIFFDETRQVGTAVANGSGNFTFVFTVPGGVGLGSHIIRAIPDDPRCDPTVRINVVAGTGPARQVATGVAGQLGKTGTDPMNVLFVAFALVVAGTMLVLGARRRARVRQSVGT